jgi:hypothetical protein
MGAINESSAIYITVADGNFVRRFKQPTDSTVTRVNKIGKTVYEEFYKGWKGRISRLEFKEHDEYGEFLNVTMTDEDGDVVIQLKVSSGTCNAFMKMLPNIDLKEDVTLTPTQTIEGEKKKSGMFANQNGVAVKWYYTKDNPNGLPQLKKVKVKGKEQWDDSDAIEFLKEMVNLRAAELYSKKHSAPAAVTEDEDAPF